MYEVQFTKKNFNKTFHQEYVFEEMSEPVGYAVITSRFVMSLRGLLNKLWTHHQS